VLSALALAWLADGKVMRARALVDAFDSSIPLPLQAYNRLIKAFGRERSLRGALGAAGKMREAKVESDHETMEAVANAAVRSVEFLMGAVSMATLPAELPEACFAGRSNVGKSSLVNMLTNRKKLAFTSKTPGKTQQFNFFLINGQDIPAHQFYLVDLPGVGYAEVPLAVRKDWLKFYQDYLRDRPSLKVLFQLIDGRHGPMNDDRELMKLFASTQALRPDGVKHVVVLTKMDKMDGKIKKQILQQVEDALKGAGLDPSTTPVVLSSAQTKLGRDELWQYLSLAATANWEDVDRAQGTMPGGRRQGGHGRDSAGNAIKKGRKLEPFKGLDRQFLRK